MSSNKEFFIRRIESGIYLVYRKGNVIGEIKKEPSGQWVNQLQFPFQYWLITATKTDGFNWMVAQYKELVKKGLEKPPVVIKKMPDQNIIH